jgi:hypothetical protein
MRGSVCTLIRDTNNTGPITMAMTDTATTAMRMNIGGTNGSGGTGTIIGTITIGIMIETTTGIDP